MTKPIVIIITIFVILVSTTPTHAQLSANTPRMGILHPGFPAKSMAYQAFIKGLRDLGYVEGKSITIIRRFAKGQRDRLPAMAADLVRRKVAAR